MAADVCRQWDVMVADVGIAGMRKSAWRVPRGGSGEGVAGRSCGFGQDGAGSHRKDLRGFCSRSGAIKLMHRPGLRWYRPKQLPRQAEADVQQRFIKQYESPMKRWFLSMRCILNTSHGRPMAGSASTSMRRCWPPPVGRG